MENHYMHISFKFLLSWVYFSISITLMYGERPQVSLLCRQRDARRYQTTYFLVSVSFSYLQAKENHQKDNLRRKEKGKSLFSAIGPVIFFQFAAGCSCSWAEDGWTRHCSKCHNTCQKAIECWHFHNFINKHRKVLMGYLRFWQNK